uniref:Uncharacterized protein n=1 Tax=Meloidogyne hapla TaxID=6305 RepID=A0A1I8B8Q5_MELHA
MDETLYQMTTTKINGKEEFNNNKNKINNNLDNLNNLSMESDVNAAKERQATLLLGLILFALIISWMPFFKHLLSNEQSAQIGVYKPPSLPPVVSVPVQLPQRVAQGLTENNCEGKTTIELGRK